MILFKRRRAKYPSQEELEAFETNHVSKPNHVIWRNVEGRAVILNTKTASYCTVEDTALRIWELIDKGVAISELTRIISDEYGKNIENVKNDVQEFLASMKEEGIIELKRGEGLHGEERQFKEACKEKIQET